MIMRDFQILGFEMHNRDIEQAHRAITELE